MNTQKTIFFTLYASNVYQHLFLLQNGVADQLTRNESVRVVFLTPPGRIPELARGSEIGQRPNVFVEELTKMPKRTLLQNAFYFFYSYLMFTSTTRLLATFGARADAPPAGGNRHFAVFKSVIASTCGKSRWIKLRAVPYLYKKIFNERPYAYVFEKYHPDLVFISNIAHFPDPEILSEAKRLDVKTVGMASNWDHLNKYYIPLHSDILLTQNEPMKKEAVEYHSYLSDEVVVVGFPEMDSQIDKEKHIQPKEAFFAKLGIPSESKLILFISGSVYYLDEPIILKKISEWIKENKFGSSIYLMVRPYPQRTEKEKYKDLEGGPHIIFNWLSNWDDVEGSSYYKNSMYYASVVIAIFSTTAIEAALWDKPILTVGFDGNAQRPYHQSIKRLEDLSHFKHVLETGSVPVARSFEELYEGIKKYLDDSALHREERKKLIDKMCYKIDGKSSERVVGILLKHING